MRKLLFLAVAVCAIALPASALAASEGAFFTDSFDTYVTGSQIAGQGGWVTWDNNPGANTTVEATQAFNPPNSLLVAGAADIVHTFVGVTSGTWHARVMTYVPSTQQGDMFFILMNTYVVNNHNGNLDWSAQVTLCKTACTNGVPDTVLNLGGSEVGGGGSIALIPDAWVELRAQIDLTNNQYQLFYGGVLFDTQQWVLTAPLRLEAMDLFSSGSSESYMDLAWVDTTAPVNLQMFSVE
jgi:hypothetical protein